MGVTPIATRTEKYAAKNIPASFDSQLQDVLGMAQADYAGFASDWVTKRDETAAVLNANGISRLMWGAYLGFSSKLWKLLKSAAGQAASLEADALVHLGTARGLTTAVLTDIREDVYNIPPPVGP